MALTMKKQTLLSKWTENVDAHHKVWSEYPRPQLMRPTWINLNGYWSYCISDKYCEIPLTHFKEDGLICVPFPIEALLSGVQRSLKPTETLWYKTNFEIDDMTDKTILHFGAVDWEANVWVNGMYIGKHKGGYYPFSFEIQKYINIGLNELIVSVEDNTDDSFEQRGKQSLHPEGLFYTAVSGIWQTVWIEQLHLNSIKALAIEMDIDRATVKFEGNLYSINCCTVEINVFDNEQPIMSTSNYTIKGVFNVEIILPHMKLWSPDTPHLYDVRITVKNVDGYICDDVQTYFAMRKVEVLHKDNEPILALNGKPIFHLGVLDQGYWPDGLYTAPTDEALIDDIIQMKNLGFNMIRKHIKVEQARFYYHCDRLGMLVWQDMINGGRKWSMVQEAVLPNLFPNWFRRDDNLSSYRRAGRADEQNRQQFYIELTEMINHLRHFPSIVVWCPFNEGWGQFDAQKVSDFVFQLDPTRLIDHASGWFDQIAGHMRSVHTYFRPLSKPKKTYERVPVISEFGGYNLKISEHTEAGHKEVGYKKCSNQEELQQSYMKLMDQLLVRIDEGLGASVYTQLSDVEGEVNGLLTYDRKVMKLDQIKTLAKHQELLKRFKQKWNVE